MAGKKKEAGESSKKAQGQARKAAAEDEKKAAKGKQVAAAEDEEWSKGSKDNSKKEAAAAKAAEAARKKAEKAALEAEELASIPSKPKGNAKKAEKKVNKGLDLSQLDSDPANSKAAALNATGIDNALDALDLTHDAQDSVDRHPERRFKAAYAVFEERRLEEMKDEKGLRRNQKIAEIRKEFEKHPDNPFNQVAGRYDMTKEELKEIKEAEKRKTEQRLAGEIV